MGLGECVRGLSREMLCTLVIFAAKASKAEAKSCHKVSADFQSPQTSCQLLNLRGRLGSHLDKKSDAPVYGRGFDISIEWASKH